MVSFTKEILTRPVHIFERVVMVRGVAHSISSEVMMLFAFPLGLAMDGCTLLIYCEQAQIHLHTHIGFPSAAHTRAIRLIGSRTQSS